MPDPNDRGVHQQEASESDSDGLSMEDRVERLWHKVISKNTEKGGNPLRNGAYNDFLNGIEEIVNDEKVYDTVNESDDTSEAHEPPNGSSNAVNIPPAAEPSGEKVAKAQDLDDIAPVEPETSRAQHIQGKPYRTQVQVTESDQKSSLVLGSVLGFVFIFFIVKWIFRGIETSSYVPTDDEDFSETLDVIEQ